MCLSVPAQIVDIKGTRAHVSVRGTLVEVSIQLLDDVNIGDFVLIHTGFAIEKINIDDAHDTLKLLDDMDKLE